MQIHLRTIDALVFLSAFTLFRHQGQGCCNWRLFCFIFLSGFLFTPGPLINSESREVYLSEANNFGKCWTEWVVPRILPFRYLGMVLCHFPNLHKTFERLGEKQLINIFLSLFLVMSLNNISLLYYLSFH